MAKFGINDIMNVKSMAYGADRVSEYKEIWLSPYEVKPSESNFDVVSYFLTLPLHGFIKKEVKMEVVK